MCVGGVLDKKNILSRTYSTLVNVFVKNKLSIEH